MPNDMRFGDYSIVEIVTLGLRDFSANLRALLIIATPPALLTALWQLVLLDGLSDQTSLATLLMLKIPEYLVYAPFYMAMLYFLGRLHRADKPAAQPVDAMLAGAALFLPFVLTTLMLTGILLVAALLLGTLVQVNGDQIVIGPGLLLGMIMVYLLILAFSFYPHVILFEQRSGTYSLSTSFKLFRAHWWRVIGVLLFPAALILIAQMLWLQMTLGADGKATQPGLLAVVSGQFVFWAGVAVLEAVRLVLFQDLRARTT